MHCEAAPHKTSSLAYLTLYVPRANTSHNDSRNNNQISDKRSIENTEKINHIKQITLARASMADGQTLLAFNDFFIGANSHVSARYRIEIGDKAENQSSSGIIVSTGAGSTGWLQSIYAGAAGVIEALGGKVIPPPNGGRLNWDTEHLVYSVREPFPSKATQTSIVHGTITNDTPLKITRQMPTNGIIFSDGIEADYLEFNSGAELTIETASNKANLIVPPEWKIH